MGFSLSGMIADLEAALNDGATNQEIKDLLDWWKYYAKDCGKLDE